MRYLDRKSKCVFSQPVYPPTHHCIILTMLFCNHFTTRRCRVQLLKCTTSSRRNFVPPHSILISCLPSMNCLESSKVWPSSLPNPVDGRGLEPGDATREQETRNWGANLDPLQPQRVIRVSMSRNRPRVEGMLEKGEGECACERKHCWNRHVHNNANHVREWVVVRKLPLVIALNFITKKHHQQQQLQEANKITLCGRNYCTLTPTFKPDPTLPIA